MLPRYSLDVSQVTPNATTVGHGGRDAERPGVGLALEGGQHHDRHDQDHLTQCVDPDDDGPAHEDARDDGRAASRDDVRVRRASRRRARWRPARRPAPGATTGSE